MATRARRILLPESGRKPIFGSVRVLRDHPLSRSLVGLYLFNEAAGQPMNLLNERPIGGGALWKMTRAGLGAENFTGTAAASAEANLTSGAWGVAALGYVSGLTLSEQPTLFGRVNYVDETNNQGWLLSGDSNSKWRFGCFNNNGFGNYNLHSTSDRVAGVSLVAGTTDGFQRTIAVITESGSETDTTGNNPSAASASAGLANAAGATEHEHCLIAWVWNGRAPTVDDLRSLFRDPFQQLESIRMPMRMKAPVAAASILRQMMMHHG